MECKTLNEEDFKSYLQKGKLDSINSCRHVNRSDLYLDFNLAKKLQIYIFF